MSVLALVLCFPLLAHASHKLKPVRLATPHAAQGQQVVKEASGLQRGLMETRGHVGIGVAYVLLQDQKHLGHQDATIFLVVANETDKEEELPVHQDHFFAFDGETGRVLPMFDESIERASILGQAPPPAYTPPPPPPSYTVTNSDGSTGTLTPQTDGIREAGNAIAAAIQTWGYEKQRDAELQSLETHFHDALLQPGKAMDGWLVVHEVPQQHPLRLIMYVGGERFVFAFGPEYQKYQLGDKKPKTQ